QTSRCVTFANDAYRRKMDVPAPCRFFSANKRGTIAAKIAAIVVYASARGGSAMCGGGPLPARER
ncbi:MAG TPA: hypothetical protein VN808_00440, partial [Stellaceae bacterium]|nr:hypothetical protein [Stellaceae bacterium]